MNKLTTEKRSQIVGCLVEGMSIRATVRITGAAKNTVTKLVVELGTSCKEYQDKVFRNLECKRIQCDEIWSFCYAKEKNVPQDLKGLFGFGDIWTWTAICADTKLIPCWLVANRSAAAAKIFIEDLASRLKNRVQLTTDGHKAYLQAVEDAFGGDIDYAMLVKIYGNENDTSDKAARKYSPVECTGTKTVRISGHPDEKSISTSFAERSNLTIRMSMRRFTRLTNGFSKKVENHEAAVALFLMYYNFGRIHQTLRVTPAMEAGITDHVWTLEEIINLIA
ncbi:MAG: IS1 family transposase [Deltaproteobacteria bacterium]|nr:IS1 family transposase [Deltaproteobacteria bacterium]